MANLQNLQSCGVTDRHRVRHFIPVFDTVKGSKSIYAKDVSIGDNVMMVGANGPAFGTVLAKHLTISKGLYNPYTKVHIYYQTHIIRACNTPQSLSHAVMYCGVLHSAGVFPGMHLAAAS